MVKIGDKVKWTSYGVGCTGKVESIRRSAATVRRTSGPMKGKLYIALASSLTVAG